MLKLIQTEHKYIMDKAEISLMTTMMEVTIKFLGFKESQKLGLEYHGLK